MNSRRIEKSRVVDDVSDIMAMLPKCVYLAGILLMISRLMEIRECREGHQTTLDDDAVRYTCRD